jgi:uncharacterized protein YjbI with pentapeptide repeats
MIDVDASTLSSANLNNQNLHRLIARGQDFCKATFVEANLRDAILDHSRFEETIFKSANLINCVARSCRFVKADFREARLLHAQLEWSDFTNSLFEGADVQGASFKNCWVCGVDFSEATGLAEANFENAIYDLSTKWPTSFVPTNAEQFEDMNGKPWD